MDVLNIINQVYNIFITKLNFTEKKQSVSNHNHTNKNRQSFFQRLIYNIFFKNIKILYL